MKSQNSLLLAITALFSLSGCNVVFGVEPGQLAANYDVPPEIDADTTWTHARIPVLNDIVRVKSGTTLIIEAGTQILGQNDSGLFIEPGAKLIANGTASDPIVFTSAEKPSTDGDWRGIFLCGNAPINGVPSNNFTDGALPDAFIHSCGGSDPEDSSGELHYVRIEFPGDGSDSNDAAGLELIGVGSNTIIDHIQVHMAADDAFVVYGGTVSMRYLLATAYGDEGLDYAYGWQGNAQFVAGYSLRGDGGIEGGGGTLDSVQPGGTTPSNPTICNATFVGDPSDTGSNIGITLRDGVKGSYINFLVAEYGELGFRVRDEDTKANAVAGSTRFENSIFSNALDFPDASDFADMWLESTWLMDPTRNNRQVPASMHGIRSLSPTELDFSVTGPSLTGAATPPDNGFFDTSVTFVGACGEACPDFKGWTSFPNQ